MQYTYLVLHSEYEEVYATGVRKVHLLRTHYIFQQRDVSHATFFKFSQMIIDHPEIKEVDINPLIPQGNDLIAVDARIILDPEPGKHPHLIITPYPTKYMKSIILKDGQKVLLRPIKPEDENMWLEMFKKFSEETVRFRFFRIIKDTPHEVRTRYCNIDYDREIGIVAEVEKDGKKQLLGVARLIQDPSRPDEAEFAVVVSDVYQRQGLGSEFLDFLIKIAEDKKLSKINGVVLKDNYPMITLCREIGFKFSDGDPGEYKVEYDIFQGQGITDGTLESDKKINDSDDTTIRKTTKKILKNQLVAAAISAGVFAHANKHGSRHATAWGVAAFLAAGIAVPLYFVRYWTRRS